MKTTTTLIFLILLVSCSSKNIKPTIEPQPTADDFYQLYDWFQSALLIYKDDPLESEVEVFLNHEVVPLWDDNAMVFMWGFGVKTDDPYSVGLDIARQVKQADDNYQYNKVPYDESFFDDYEYYETPEGALFCSTYEDGCWDDLFAEEANRQEQVDKHGVFKERYLKFLTYSHMQTVSLMTLASALPGFKNLIAGQRLYHLSLIEAQNQGDDIIHKLLNEFIRIRLRLTQTDSLIGKMIIHVMAAECVDFLSYLLQKGLISPLHPELVGGLARLTTAEISTRVALQHEQLSGMRMLNEFTRDVEMLISNKPKYGHVYPILKIMSHLVMKPNMTLNAQYNATIKPLMSFTELDADKFFIKYQTTQTENHQDFVRNNLSSKLLLNINDFKTMYLPYQGRLYSLDMKIQLLNGLIEEGSYEKVMVQAATKGKYLNTYNENIPFIEDGQICYSGVFENNDKHRCMQIIEVENTEPNEASSDDGLPVYHITREQIDDIEIETVGQLMMVLSAKLPIPEGETTYQSIVSELNETDNKIIEDTGDYILVQCYEKNKETGEVEPSFITRYFFKDGVLTRGPVLVDLESMKETNITGKRIK